MIGSGGCSPRVCLQTHTISHHDRTDERPWWPLLAVKADRFRMCTGVLDPRKTGHAMEVLPVAPARLSRISFTGDSRAEARQVKKILTKGNRGGFCRNGRRLCKNCKVEPKKDPRIWNKQNMIA